VGVPYFEAVFVPLMTPALFLIGIGPISRWRQSPVIDLAHKLKWAAAVSVISAILAPLVLRSWTPLIGFGLFLAVWIIATTCTQLLERAFSNRERGVIKNLVAQPASYYGMFLAHIGVAVFIIGITGVRGFESEKDVRMAIGSSIEAGGYNFQFLGVQAIQGPNYQAVRGVFDVSQDGKVITRMEPEKRVYTASQMPMTEAAIDPGLTRDLYVSLGEPINANEWTVRIHIKPFVDWIWGGCLFMALGGFLAITDRRYRKRK
jgi:cytochrome c-type biogenesis protein CcmF